MPPSSQLHPTSFVANAGALERAQALVAGDLQRVEGALLGLCQAEGRDPLCAAARSAVEAGGKRLRPTLTLLCAAALAEPTETTIRVAMAVETMHLASLMHDDVVDQAALRRGRPAATVVLGNRLAVLVGDFLATSAYLELARSEDPRYLMIMAQTGLQMCQAEGLASQLDSEAATEDMCLAVARGKTAGLMATACQLGGLSVGANHDVAESFRTYGEHLGIAFQLTDDLLDIYGDQEETGKEPGRDILGGQVTLPIAHALRSSLGLRVRELIAALPSAPDPRVSLRELGRLVEEAGGKAAAQATAAAYVAHAKDVLGKVPAAHTEPLEALCGIADYVLTRNQ